MINFSEIVWRRGPRQDAERAAGFTDSEYANVSSPLRRSHVDEVSLDGGSHAALLLDQQSAGADRLRYLRLRLRELRQLARLQSIVVTSPLPGDGKSTIALCLAATLSDGGKHPTLLIEGDLHRPTLARTLGLKPRIGLAECLEDGIAPMAAVRKINPLGCYVLYAGTPKGSATELLQSEALASLNQSVAPHFEWIVVDSPPALPLTDAYSISRQVDATLLVARADRTPQDAIDATIKLIGRKHILGIILNAASDITQTYSEYYRSPSRT